MKPAPPTELVKRLLGTIPYTADLYDALRRTRPRTRYNLSQLEAALPEATAQARQYAQVPPRGEKILLFATLHYWVEQAAMIALVLRGMGHEVAIAYLPYADWRKQINAFDLRRQDIYTRRVLAPMEDLVKVVSLLDVHSTKTLPPALNRAIETASAYDTMYSLQVEEFAPDLDLYQLRLKLNRSAALAGLSLLDKVQPDVVLVPNALVTELGTFYQVARHLDLLTVTYEFNDQREQVWLAQNGIVMHQDTDALWAARGGTPLTVQQREQIAALEDARSSARKYGKGTRFWQDVASVGGEELRRSLGLDGRPVVLLATNVLGDSLTLGRNVFAESNADWIAKTVRYFAGRDDVQLLIRIHPGERLMKGPSMTGVIEKALPERPGHIHIIGPDEQVNTYDCMELAGLGLAYTTTVGMEMAMRAVPVIVAGRTHYRGRGFTFDPVSWEEYYALLDRLLGALPAHRLTREQVETAWNYAYRFFFDFPFPFPWRLMHFWRDVKSWPIGRVLSAEGGESFGHTFACLAGEPVVW